MYRRKGFAGYRGFGDVQCGSGLVPTGNALAPCVYPGVATQQNAPSGGTTGGGCISVADLSAKCGGSSQNCDPHDQNCIAQASAVWNWVQDQMYANGFPYTCIPANISCPNLSASQQQQVTQAFESNTPIDLGPGTAAFQYAAPAPAPSSTPIPSAAPTPLTQTLQQANAATPTGQASAPASAALQMAQASVSGSDWFTQSMFGSIPNWMLLAGAGIGVFALASMGGHR